jgi:hypothetical protein
MNRLIILILGERGEGRGERREERGERGEEGRERGGRGRGKVFFLSLFFFPSFFFFLFAFKQDRICILRCMLYTIYYTVHTILLLVYSIIVQYIKTMMMAS